MKTIVVTGGTRGIGYGLAQAFLARGCRVAFCGRSPEAVERAALALADSAAPEQILGMPCDVSQADQVQALWDSSHTKFGKIDIWINNAGIGGEHARVWETSPDSARQVVETNLLGTIYGAQTAVSGMLAQGGGDVYIMEGMGVDGRRHAGLTFYGMTKYGLDYFFKSLVEETKNTTVRVGALMPGMVNTDLVTGPYQDRPVDWQRVIKVFNIIADRVENVAPWMADAILANQRHGAVLSYSSPVKLFWRFLISPFSQRDIFSNAP